MRGVGTHRSVVIGTVGSCKSSYHVIMTKMPHVFWIRFNYLEQDTILLLHVHVTMMMCVIYIN